MDYLSLCLVCKDENDYLPEWLDYHILMGVDRFYIYDNESQISLRESLHDYISRGWVVVIDIPGKAMQLYAYDHCLQTFGANTFWMGFIDTDEFLVPKAASNLKELLKDYEAYGGLAVSSLFFGSNGHKTRPRIGQIAAYTLRTHETYKENELIKSIVQPGRVQMTNSPHDFVYQAGAWCVNEGFLRVDYQRFPNYTEKIQLNHYYCRSGSEIALKLSRGRGDTGDAWPRRRFDTVNSMATYEDVTILQNLDELFKNVPENRAEPLPAEFLEKMAVLAQARHTAPLGGSIPREAASFRAEFAGWMKLKDIGQLALDNNDIKNVCQSLLNLIQLQPQHVYFYVDLAINYLKINDPASAWGSLSQAWQLFPNNYAVLNGMAYYFLKVSNFPLAENTCQLLLAAAPHDLVILSMLTYSLIGQGRYDEALKVGVPVVELSAVVGELPDQMGIYLVKKMADYLLEKQDYAGAARLWQAGVKCQPGDANALLELSRALFLAGDRSGARQRLAQSSSIGSQNPAELAFRSQVEALFEAKKKKKH